MKGTHIMSAAQAPAAHARVIPEFLHPAHGAPARATRAAALASAAAVAGAAGGPFEPMPAPLSRAVRATAAILPTQGEDPLAHLGQVCDAFQEFNPIDHLEIMLVSQYLVLGGTFLGLMTRTADPDLPP